MTVREVFFARRAIPVLLVFLLVPPSILPAEILAETQPAKTSPAKTQESGDSEKEKERERMVLIAIFLLVLLAVGTVSGLILLILWGVRVRRQARKPLPATSPRDPLWYLKSPSSKKREPNDSSEASDETTPPPSPNAP